MRETERDSTFLGIECIGRRTVGVSSVPECIRAQKDIVRRHVTIPRRLVIPGTKKSLRQGIDTGRKRRRERRRDRERERGETACLNVRAASREEDSI